MLPGGWLAIEGIRFRCIIGVNERERQSPQEIVADLYVKVDFEKAAASDSIQDTVDYRVLTRRLIAAGETSRFQLVETLATHLVRVLLDESVDRLLPERRRVRSRKAAPDVLECRTRHNLAIVMPTRTRDACNRRASRRRTTHPLPGIPLAASWSGRTARRLLGHLRDSL